MCLPGMGAGNNLFMLNGEGCLTLDTMSIVRTGESKNLPIAEDLWLTKTPEGPAARLAPSFGFHTYIIWNFAENIDGAKQFLADYIGHSREAFLASGFQTRRRFRQRCRTWQQWLPMMPVHAHRASTIYWRISRLGRPMLDILGIPVRRSVKSTPWV